MATREKRSPNRRSTRLAPVANASAWVAVAAVFALLASGCAYYNTFYTARKNYKEAETQHLTSGQEHPAPQVLELYQRSIERSEKVITRYPKSKWVDDARYLIGMAHLKREDWDKGQGAFEDLIAKHPDSKLIPDARLGVGLAYLGRGEWKEADQALENLLTDYPRFDRKGEVLFHLSRSYAKRRDYRRAINGFTELLEGDVEAMVRVETLEARGEAYLAVDAPDSALTDFQALVRLQSRADERLDAELRVGECLERLARLEEALGHYARLEREMPEPNHLPRTLLARGRTLGDLGRHAEALAVYERVATDFPASNYAAQAQYQIGLTLELQLNDVDKAKEAYSKVSQIAGSSEFADLAAERRQSLDLFGQYREEMSTGGEEEQKAQAGFLLAELNLFRLRKVEEALAQYRAVEHDYPQSPLAPKAAFAVSWILEHEIGDSAAADSAYRQVFNRYPKTEYGVQAGVKAGLLSADSLSIHLGEVLRRRAVADSLAAVTRLHAAADSLGVGLAEAADSLLVEAEEAKADSAATAAADSAANAAAQSRADSLRMARERLLLGGAQPDSLAAPFDPAAIPRRERSPMLDSLLIERQREREGGE